MFGQNVPLIFYEEYLQGHCSTERAPAQVSRLLEYTPSARITPLQACAHTFFDELREPGETNNLSEI